MKMKTKWSIISLLILVSLLAVTFRGPILSRKSKYSVSNNDGISNIMVATRAQRDQETEIILEHIKAEYEYYYAERKPTTRDLKLSELRKNLFPIDQHTEYERFFINVPKSHSIPVDRRIPDTRPYECRKISYTNPTLPKVSVIIPLHDEPWSTMLRTLHSILDRTPDKYLEEIILVDDQSKLEFLKHNLTIYVTELSSKIQIIRSASRLGTMKCRMYGASHAKGQVVMFLDSHTEVNKGWVEPILWEIYKNRKTIIQPAVDVIDPETLRYENYMNNIRGDFEWTMGFTFAPLPPRQLAGRNPSDPIITPAIVGCSFAVERNYFFEIGGLDSGMKTWGAEDVELAIRTWLCGGNVKILECSRVGHIFKKGHPFKVDYSELLFNERRIAELWLDDYKHIFYSVHEGRISPPSNFSDFKEMMELKERLQCRNFDWFLKTIFPELEVPPENSIRFGKVKNEASQLCVGVTDLPDASPLELRDCWGYESNQIALTKHGLLMLNGRCISVTNNYLVLKACNDNEPFEWSYRNQQLTWSKSQYCAMQVIDPDSRFRNRQTVMLMSCYANIGAVNFTKWTFTYNLETQYGEL